MDKDLLFEQIHPFVRYVRFLELNKDVNYPPFTPYDCRLFYTYKGNGAIYVEDKKYEMPKGSIIFLPSAVPYHLISPNDNSVIYIALNFDLTYDYFEINYPIPPDKKENFNNENVLENVNFIDLPLFNEPIYLNNIQAVENDLLDIENEFRHIKRYFNNKISAILQNVLLVVARRGSFISLDSNEQTNIIDTIIQYIHAHYNETLTNHVIGEQFNFHPNYINNLMVMHTGLSLHQYIISLRISNAIGLLETTNMQITEIAYTVGFKDMCHFSRYFKKTTGRNPRDFRCTPNKSIL